MSGVVNVWWMSGVINVCCGQCPILHTVWWMSGVVNVWCGECLLWLSGGCLVWWMSGVVNVLFYTQCGECLMWSMSYNQSSPCFHIYLFTVGLICIYVKLKLLLPAPGPNTFQIFKLDLPIKINLCALGLASEDVWSWLFSPWPIHGSKIYLLCYAHCSYCSNCYAPILPVSMVWPTLNLMSNLILLDIYFAGFIAPLLEQTILVWPG